MLNNSNNEKIQKYLYLEPRGGFNDILTNISNCLDYCRKHQRILLVNGEKTLYKINFSDYFYPPFNTIIDTETIKEICLNTQNTVHPFFFQDKMLALLKGEINFSYAKEGWLYKENGKNVNLELITGGTDQDIVIYSSCGAGDGYKIFKELVFKDNLMNICKERYASLKKPFLGIQIRNTDYSCDYPHFYNKHESLIKSYEEVYLASDDIRVLDFFNEKNVNFKNFTTYPHTKYKNLHSSNISPHTKFIDMISDIYILSLSNKLISPSKGGFIKLIRDVSENRDFIL